MITYRNSNIDSLRTFSALIVFFYHVDLLDSGFIGVDIFFAISGYIITSILFEKKQDLKNIILFLIKRINRILPLVIIISFFSIVFAYFFMLPEEIIFLNKTIINALFYNINNFFYLNTNYFSQISTSPILHLWTIGVEFQFYIFAIFLIIIAKKSSHHFIILVIFFSFLLSQSGGNLKFSFPYIENNLIFFNPMHGSFYILPTRIFEFLIGSWFWFNQNKILNLKFFEFLRLISFLTIFIMLIVVNKKTLTPGIYSILICVCSSFLFLESNRNNILNKILNIKIFYKPGVYTFGFYIYHYTIIYFCKLYFDNNLEVLTIILIFFTSCVLTYVSFETIEKYMINILSSEKIKIKFYLISVTSLSILILTSFFSNGFVERLDKEMINYYNKFNKYEKLYLNCRYIFNNNACVHGNKNNINTVIWGDSHANQIIPVIKNVSEYYSLGTIEFTNPGCLPIINVKESHSICEKNNQKIFNEIKKNKNIKNVILHAYWNSYIENKKYNFKDIQIIEKKINEQLLALEKLNKKIYIILGVPEMNHDPKNLFFRKKIISKFIKEKKYDNYITYEEHIKKNQINHKFFNNIKNININVFDPSIFYCEEKCFSDDGANLYYRNNNHISKLHSNRLLELLTKFLMINE